MDNCKHTDAWPTAIDKTKMFCPDCGELFDAPMQILVSDRDAKIFFEAITNGDKIASKALTDAIQEYKVSVSAHRSAKPKS